MPGLASHGQLRASIVRWSLVAVPACVLLGSLSGVMAGSGPGNPWFDALERPDIFPPAWLFGAVWPVLFALMGFALALICAAWGARGRTVAIWSFALLFTLLLAWSPVFFAMHRMAAALAVVSAAVLMAVMTIVLFWRVRRVAAILLLPLLGWLCFASALNYEFLRLNPEFDGANPTGAVQRIEI